MAGLINKLLILPRVFHPAASFFVGITVPDLEKGGRTICRHENKLNFATLIA